MTTQRQQELYVQYVQLAIVAGLIPASFNDWNADRIAVLNARKVFQVQKWSEPLRCWITFPVSAVDLPAARIEADRLLAQFESKHGVEVTADGRFLSPEQQLEKIHQQQDSIMRQLQKRLDAVQRQIDAATKKQAG